MTPSQQKCSNMGQRTYAIEKQQHKWYVWHAPTVKHKYWHSNIPTKTYEK